MSHLSNLIEKLQKSDAQAALVTSEVNQQYLTGFDFSGVPISVTSRRLARRSVMSLRF